MSELAEVRSSSEFEEINACDNGIRDCRQF